jgi:hypothetical protein
MLMLPLPAGTMTLVRVRMFNEVSTLCGPSDFAKEAVTINSRADIPVIEHAYCSRGVTCLAEYASIPDVSQPSAFTIPLSFGNLVSRAETFSIV